MPTEVNIDEPFVAAAMAAGGFSTRQEAVEAALHELLERRRRVHGLRALRGKVDWIGDLDAMRLDPFISVAFDVGHLRAINNQTE